MAARIGGLQLEDVDPKLLAAVAGVVVLLILFVVGASSSKKPRFLNRDDKSRRLAAPLKERWQLSPDTIKLRFALPTSKTILGLPVGGCMKIFCPNVKGSVAGKWNGQDDKEDGQAEIERKYTPTSADSDVGYFDLVIKVYNAGQLERFPDGGKMSQYMDRLKIGDSIELSGPWGMIEYHGRGRLTAQGGKKEYQKKAIGMMAGGSGITPMLQIIAAVLKDPSDTTKLSLIFANKCEEDILVRDMLEALQKEHPDRFSLWYTLDNPPSGWKYSKGFIDCDMIQNHLPPPGPDTAILLCGPPPMVKYACKDNLEKLQYPKEDVLSF